MAIWPKSLVPSSESWRLQNASRSGGVSITGAEQIVASGAGRWLATLTVPIKTSAQILAFRALVAGLDGRANTVAVGPFDYRRVPWAIDADGRTVGPKLRRRPWLDGTPFADSAGLIDTLVVASLTASVAIGATSCGITVTTGSPLQPGHHFELAGRLHVVTDIAGAVIRFRPKTRAAYAAGTAVVLVAPRCTMRLASDDTAALELQGSRTGTVTIDLAEAF